MIDCGRFVRVLVHALALAGALAGAEGLGARPPEWLLKCAALPTPEFAAGAPALVLLDQNTVKIDPKGRRIETRRYAVRVLAAGGEAQASASISYLSGRDTVSGLGAWLVRGGKEFKPPKSSRSWSDQVGDLDAALTEYRAKTFSYSDLASPGDVFGFEATLEGTSLFADWINIWQSRLPTLIERFDLTLPAGWNLTAVVDGDRPLVEEQSRDGLTWSWTLHDRPFRPDEPAAAEDQWFDARVVTSIKRPASAGAAGPVAFASWSDVAAWKWAMATDQCDRDAAIGEVVTRLTSGVDDPLGRMRAIAGHVQQLRYVSVSSKLGIGFGYRPRKATEVNARGWGDCKDKANLMCAMLREVGITAYLASAHIGLGRKVTPEWPSPQQFNHAIVAIPVDASVDLPAVVDTPKLGRVLFFDATDPDTVLGDIPSALQGTRVFVVIEGNNELATLPILPAGENRCLERVMEMVLAPNGGAAGRGSLIGRAQTASALRGMCRRRSARELEAMLIESLGAPLRGAVLSQVKVADDRVADRFQIDFELAAPKFCQFLPGNMVLVKLDLFARGAIPSFPNRDRVLPVDLDGFQMRESITIALPDQFAVEELPAGVTLNEAFASYKNRVEGQPGLLACERVLTLEDATVPVAEYASLRRFLGEVSKADRVSAVLRSTPR